MKETYTPPRMEMVKWELPDIIGCGEVIPAEDGGDKEETIKDGCEKGNDCP